MSILDVAQTARHLFDVVHEVVFGTLSHFLNQVELVVVGPLRGLVGVEAEVGVVRGHQFADADVAFAQAKQKHVLREKLRLVAVAVLLAVRKSIQNAPALDHHTAKLNGVYFDLAVRLLFKDVELSA